MRVDLALLADAATVDSAGKLNILGIFDSITSTRFPAKHGLISLVLRFSARSRKPEGGRAKNRSRRRRSNNRRPRPTTAKRPMAKSGA